MFKDSDSRLQLSICEKWQVEKLRAKAAAREEKLEQAAGYFGGARDYFYDSNGYYIIYSNIIYIYIYI